MSKDTEKTGFAGRLWGTGRERDPHTDEMVSPLKAPPDARGAVRPAATHDRSYVAFEIRERADRLHIVRGAGPSRFPNYHYLLDISFDHHLQSAFTLIYTFMIVEVTGSNLEPVVHAISLGNCERIRECHPKLHHRPGQGEPVIEKIQITAADEKG
jgi:hypothetical protein